ncbi:MAG TPA: hypothetical protein VLK78_04335 [Candidatus Angelobacter sp.]|nr:hypothetical protein [Candidatus Angelobacter sp.]
MTKMDMNLQDAQLNGDDTLYKRKENEQKSVNGENDLQQKYGHRDEGLSIMDGQSSEQANQEQFRQIGQSRDGQGSQNRGLDQNRQAGNDQRGHPEQGLHLSGYNIAKSDGEEFQPEGQAGNDLGKKSRDPNPEKQVDEFYQRYGQEDPLDKQI